MYNEWENQISSKGVRYSRYIASFVNELNKVGGRFYRDEFMGWLSSTGLSTDEVYDIAHLAFCGKMELESSARRYIAMSRQEKK